MAIGPGSAFADPIDLTFSYTTTEADGNGPIPGIVFTLSLDQSEGRFTISAPADSSGTGWAIGWFQLKLDAWNLVAPAGWEKMDGTTRLSHWENEKFPNNLWQGFYDPDFALNGTSINQGSIALTFGFDVDPNKLDLTGIPFQVGFYGGEKPHGGYFTDRLSQTLKVPEPSSVLLLSLGLGGVLLLAKKWIP